MHIRETFPIETKQSLGMRKTRAERLVEMFVVGYVFVLFFIISKPDPAACCHFVLRSPLLVTSCNPNGGPRR